MGGFWSKTDVAQFEKDLQKLDNNITALERRKNNAKTQRTRIISYLIYGGVISEAIILLWYYVHRKPTEIVSRIIDASPMFLFPLIVYIIKTVVSFYYAHRISSDEKKISNLRSQLKTKIETRKKATEFEATQQLLSKYERRATGEDLAGSPKAPRSPKAASGVKQPPFSSGSSQLRQRNVPGPSSPPTSPKSAASPAKPFAQQGPVPVPPGAQYPQHPRPPMPVGPANRSWMDKLVDYVVGGVPQNSYALICSNCGSHNGLVPQAEMHAIQFRCRFCNHFNKVHDASSSSSSTPQSPPSASSSTSTSTSASASASSSNANPPPTSPSHSNNAKKTEEQRNKSPPKPPPIKT